MPPPLVSLAPAALRQRWTHLRRAEQRPLPRGGLRLRRPAAPETAALPGLRSGGRDVSRLLEAGGLRLTRRLGEPWTARYRLRLDAGGDAPPAAAEDGAPLLAEDGRELLLEAADPGAPGLLEAVRLSAPTECYRDAALDLDPLAYWACAERERDLDDRSERGDARGRVDRGRVRWRAPGPLPYGAALGLAGDAAVEGPAAPALPGGLTIMLWVRAGAAARIDAGGLALAVSAASAAGAGAGPAPLAAGWRHVALSAGPAGAQIYVDGEAAGPAGPAAGAPGGPLRLGGAADVAEAAVYPRPLSAAEVAGCWAARAGERLYAGVATRLQVRGRAGSARQVVDVDAAGVDEALRAARPAEELRSDGSETVRQLIQRLLDDEAPHLPICADGVAVEEIVAPLAEDAATLHAVIARLAELHEAAWWLDPYGELQMVRTADAAPSGVTLDEAANIAASAPPMVVDARLYRSAEAVAGAAGWPAEDRWTSDGRTRIYRLSLQPLWSAGVRVEVDGAAQQVDSAGSYAYDAPWAADQGASALVVPGGRDVPAAGAVIVARYTSARRQQAGAADPEAVRRYGLRSHVRYDASPNVYRRREAMAAAAVAAHAAPVRRIAVRGRAGRLPLPRPGTTYAVRAPSAWGVDGGDPWLCTAATATADPRMRAVVELELQQGPWRPLADEYWARLDEADARLAPPAGV